MTVDSDIRELYDRVRALEANRAGGLDRIPIASAVAIWDSGFGSSAFATYDSYATGVAQDLPLFTVLGTGGFDGSIVTSPDDDLSLRCSSGVYIAVATMFLTDDLSYVTLGANTDAFDLLFRFISSSTRVYSYTGGGAYGLGFWSSVTNIRRFPPVSGNTGSYESIAQSQILFEVPAGETADVRAVVMTNLVGQTFVYNAFDPTNPGASNLTIVRFGGNNQADGLVFV